MGGVYFVSGTFIYRDISNNHPVNFDGGLPAGLGDLVEMNVNGDSCDVYHNIMLESMFIDTTNGDYHLTAESSCIDAGNPDSPYDPDGTIADMGAFYYNQNVGIDELDDILPDNFMLSQNYPNPFNAFTLIRYELPMQSQVTIEIFDILGRRVTTLLDEQQLAGFHQAAWNATDHPSGVYFYRLRAENYINTKKMLLLK